MAGSISVPTAVSSATSALGRSGMGGGAYTSSSKSVEGPSGGSFIGLDGQWLPASDQGGNTGQGGFHQYGDQQRPLFSLTPLMFINAAVFTAQNGTGQTDSKDTRLPLSDLQHGIGIYEFNMQLTAGNFSGHGEVVNRYS